MRAVPGDWIIKGVKGEFYPCKPDIFAATYEPVVSPSVDPVERDDKTGELLAVHKALLMRRLYHAEQVLLSVPITEGVAEYFKKYSKHIEVDQERMDRIFANVMAARSESPSSEPGTGVPDYPVVSTYDELQYALERIGAPEDSEASELWLYNRVRDQAASIAALEQRLATVTQESERLASNHAVELSSLMVKLAAAEADTKRLEGVYVDIRAERARQDAQWGGAGHDDLHTEYDWSLFRRKFEKKAQHTLDSDYVPLYDLAAGRDALVKIAALAVAQIESVDRRSPRSGEASHGQ